MDDFWITSTHEGEWEYVYTLEPHDISVPMENQDHDFWISATHEGEFTTVSQGL